jgi:D-xylono/L-arabinono-1,4-lactonase
MMDIAAKNICVLGECPVWNEGQQRLYWSDILQGKIYRFDPATKEYQLFWQGEQKVGGFAFTKKGDMVICSDKGVYIMKNGKNHLELLFDIPFDSNERFNDVTTDPAGRMLAGSLKTNYQEGKLYRLEKNRTPVVVMSGIGCSNGMAFSMDAKKFFHTDSVKHEITMYDYDRITGDITNPVLFFKAKESEGLPDGITIDIDDNLWAAFWGGSCVRRISKYGKIVETIPVPAIQPSSVMFGGRGLNELYITSACEDGADLEHGLDARGNFLGGYLYRYYTNTRGRAEFPADF